MKSDNESFDQLIRNKVEQRAFEPGPGSWEKAQQLIDADQSGRRRRAAFWLFFLLAAGGISAFLFFGPFGKNTSGKEKLSVHTTNETLYSQDKRAGKHPDRAAANASSDAITPGLSQETSAAPGFSNENENNSSSQSAAGTTTGTTSAAGSENSKPLSASGKTQDSKQSSHTAVQNSQHGKGGTVSSGNGNTQPVVKTNGANSVTEDQHAENNPGTAEHTYASGMNHADSANIYASGMNHPDSSGSYTGAGMNTADSVRHSIQPDNAAHTAENTDDNEEDNYHQLSGHTAGWLAEAGLTFLPGSTGFNSSVNPVIGAGYYFPVGNNFGIETGLQYTFLNHASDSSIVYTSTDYSFGVETHKTEIGLRRLHYVAVPLNFYWHFNDNNAIFAGANFHYLFATESRERSYTESYNSIRDEQVRSVFGYDAGIKNIDLLVTGGYAHYFGPRWSIQASAYYGLMDLKDNNVYGVSKFERNAGLRFTLQYRF